MPNQLMKVPEGKAGRCCPPDMPRGDTEADKAARARFWVDRGNADLVAKGQGHLQWKHLNGHYWIEERA